MLTAFGKYLRKVRLDHDEVMKNMADRLGVTSSYLSAIENGKRKIPDEWINKIAALYNVDRAELQKVADLSADELIINLSNKTKNQRDAMFSFARNFENLDEEDQNVIINLLKKE